MSDAVFLTLLWNDVSHTVHSEPELNHRYADLCLLLRPDARASRLVDLLQALVQSPTTWAPMVGSAVALLAAVEGPGDLPGPVAGNCTQIGAQGLRRSTLSAYL